MVISLDSFKPRDYQIPIIEALEHRGYRKIVCVMPRRSGKDFMSFWLIIRAAVQKTAVYFMIYPTYAQGKKILWDSITNDGVRFIDMIPRQLIESSNSQTMSIRLKNGSLIQIVGSDNPDSLVGTNCYGAVFSEYALQSPVVYQLLRPILVANGGFCIFISTPRSKNHLYDLYRIAQDNPDEWFSVHLTVEQTKHIPLEEIEKERREGLISEDMIMQEYYCSWDLGVEGAYYSKYIDKMHLNSRITTVPWENNFKVHTAWDLGMADQTCIIMYQVVGTTIRIINTYSNSGHGLDHYIKKLQQIGDDNNYTWGRHIAPHDIKVRELGTGVSRLEKARSLGIEFTIAPDLSIDDGIEAVRSTLSRVWIDNTNCKDLIKALESYRHEYDAKRQVYKTTPLHDFSSHYCFVADTLVLTRTGMRPIIEIRDSDQVLTLEGWKSCTKVFKTRENAQLVEVTFQDGTTVKCTPDHLFLTEIGWISAQNLAKDLKIQSSLINGYSTLMGRSLGSIPMKNTSKDTPVIQQSPYIDSFGKLLSGLFQKTVTFIMLMATQPIILFQILYAYLLKSIVLFQNQTTKALATNVGLGLSNGTNQMQAGNGTDDKPINVNHGKIGRKNKEIASGVIKNSQHLLDQEDLIRNGVMPIVKPLLVESVVHLNQREDVYCISVPSEGHFSLSNGAIVKNCDAMRYLCISLAKTADGLTPEELDRRYNQSVFGNKSNLPRFFNENENTVY